MAITHNRGRYKEAITTAPTDGTTEQYYYEPGEDNAPGRVMHSTWNATNNAWDEATEVEESDPNYGKAFVEGYDYKTGKDLITTKRNNLGIAYDFNNVNNTNLGLNSDASVSAHQAFKNSQAADRNFRRQQYRFMNQNMRGMTRDLKNAFKQNVGIGVSRYEDGLHYNKNNANSVRGTIHNNNIAEITNLQNAKVKTNLDRANALKDASTTSAAASATAAPVQVSNTPLTTVTTTPYPVNSIGFTSIDKKRFKLGGKLITNYANFYKK